MTQKEAILNHLKTAQHITSIEATEQYGVTRLSAIIFNLRKDGNIITAENETAINRYGHTSNYAVYKLVKAAAQKEAERQCS